MSWWHWLLVGLALWLVVPTVCWFGWLEFNGSRHRRLAGRRQGWLDYSRRRRL